MITLLVLAALIGIAVMVGRNLGPRPPALAVAVARMDRARMKPHRHHHDDDDPHAYLDNEHESAIHEAGHIIATEDAGLRWSEAVVHKGGGGYVEVDWSSDGSDLERAAVNAVSIYRAGEYALHSGKGAQSDRANVDRVLRGVPSKVRSRIRAQGERQARAAVSRRRGAADRYRVRLEKKGRIYR